MGEPESSNNMQRVLSEFMMGIHTPRPSRPYIYKIPKEFRGGDNEKHFEPTLVCIGPLHHDPHNPALELKKEFLWNFIKRIVTQELKKGFFKSFNDRLGSAIDEIAEALSALEATIRDCYKDVDLYYLGREEFMKMMLLDGCFIVELLMSHDSNSSTTHVGNMAAEVPLATLQLDLLKIENQLPFIVLKTIANFIPSSEDNNMNQGSKLIDLALKFLNIAKPESTTNEEPRHLLELAMNALFYKVGSDPSSSTIVQVDEKTEIDSLQEAKPASSLVYYGIKFIPGDSNILTNVEFDNGIFKIPQIVIEESTMTLYHNFMIFETFFCRTRIFTSYIKFMKTLIKTEQDAEVLLKSKIIVSSINDVAILASSFRNLSAYVSYKHFLFEMQLQKVNRYCQSFFPDLRASFMKVLWGGAETQ